MPTITAQAEAPKSAPVSPIPQTERQASTNEEVTQVETPKVTEETLSPKFAALARKEKAMRQEAMKQKAERDAWMAEKAKYEQEYIPRSGLKEAALQALRAGQIPYDDFAQEALKDDFNPTIAKLQAEIAELKGEQNKFKVDNEQKAKNEYQAAVNQIRNDVKILVSSNTEFEMVNALDQSESVVALIEETFKEEGRVMTIEEAAKQVEDYLLEEANKILKIEKVKSKMAPQETAQATQKLPDTQKPQIKTLTNATTVATKPMSSRERAIAAFKGQLK